MLFLCRCQTLGFRLHALSCLQRTLAFRLRRLDVADGLLHRAVGIGDNLLCLLACIAKYLMTFAFNLLVELLVFGSHLCQKVVRHLQLRALPCHLLLVELELLQLMFEVEHLAAHLLACRLEHLFGEADTLCYLKGEGATRMPNGETVERLHLLCVEQHRPVADARTFVCQQLQVGIVGSDDTEGVAAVQLFEQCLGNGAARPWFGAPTQLVKQKEGALVSRFQQLFHILQMRSVCAQVVVYRLLVADVDEYIVEDAKLRCLTAGHQHTALQHVLYQPHRFQAHRLATRVRSRYYQYVGIVVQLYVERHHLALVVEIEQRMPRVEPVDLGDAVHDGTSRVQRQCETCLGADEVDACQEPIGVDERIQLGAYHIGKAGQYLLYLVPLGELQFAKVVVQFHHLRGLQIGGLPRRRLVVDKALNLATVGVEHRYHHAPVADSHLGILGCPAFMLGACQLTADLYVHVVALLGHLPADVQQGVRRVVVYLALVVDNLVQCLGDSGVEFHTCRQFVQHRVAHRVVAHQKTQALPDGVQRAFEVEQCLQLYHRVAHTQACQLLSEVYKVLRREAVLQHQYLAKLLGLLQLAHHAVVAVRERHLAHHAHCQRVGTLRCHQFPYLGKP